MLLLCQCVLLICQLFWNRLHHKFLLISSISVPNCPLFSRGRLHMSFTTFGSKDQLSLTLIFSLFYSHTWFLWSFKSSDLLIKIASDPYCFVCICILFQQSLILKYSKPAGYYQKQLLFLHPCQCIISPGYWLSTVISHPGWPGT